MAYTRIPLHESVKKGDLKEVLHFICKDNNVNVTDSSGYTPLHWASDFGHLEIAQLLVNKGCHINPEGGGCRPIHLAAEQGHIHLLEFFLKIGVFIDEIDHRGRTSLHRAVSNGKFCAVRFLLNKGSNVQAKDNWGANSVHRAAERGYRDIVEFLLNEEVNVNDIMKYYRTCNVTALHVAIKNGRLDVVKLLVDRGAKIHISHDEMEPIHLAAKVGKQSIVEFFLHRGVDINARNISNGKTPLHYAAMSGDAIILGLLIDKGADFHAVDDDGKTLFDHVTSPKSIEMHKLLIRYDKIIPEPKRAGLRNIDKDYRDREEYRRQQRENEPSFISTLWGIFTNLTPTEPRRDPNPGSGVYLYQAYEDSPCSIQ